MLLLLLQHCQDKLDCFDGVSLLLFRLAAAFSLSVSQRCVFSLLSPRPFNSPNCQDGCILNVPVSGAPSLVYRLSGVLLSVGTD